MEFSEYFDKVYLINLVEHKDKKEFIINEMKSLGIYDELVRNNKLEIVEAIRFPWITDDTVRMLCDNGVGDFYTCGRYSAGLYNCTCEHYRVIKKSVLKGYNRILILEDDACFFKNIEGILKALKTMPEDFNILHLEGYYFPDNNYPTWEDAKGILSDSINDAYWAESRFLPLWATAGLIYSRNGMLNYLKLQDENLKWVDYYTCLMSDKCYFYTYPLIRQEDKSETYSDIVSQYDSNYEQTNVYLSKCKRNEYFKKKDFVI